MNNYYEMCYEAVKIQAQWKPKVGDLFIRRESRKYPWDEIDMDALSRPVYKSTIKASDWILWLPRIEDLVEMSADKAFGCDAHDHWLDAFWLFTQRVGTVNSNDMLQEMTLKYVMHELYNKFWNGKTWEAK